MNTYKLDFTNYFPKNIILYWELYGLVGEQRVLLDRQTAFTVQQGYHTSYFYIYSNHQSFDHYLFEFKSIVLWLVVLELVDCDDDHLIISLHKIDFFNSFTYVHRFNTYIYPTILFYGRSTYNYILDV